MNIDAFKAYFKCITKIWAVEGHLEMSGGFRVIPGPDKGRDVGFDIDVEVGPDGDLGVDFSVGFHIDVKHNITLKYRNDLKFIFVVWQLFVDLELPFVFAKQNTPESMI